jgi:hypothetical protein
LCRHKPEQEEFFVDGETEAALHQLADSEQAVADEEAAREAVQNSRLGQRGADTFELYVANCPFDAPDAVVLDQIAAHLEAAKRSLDAPTVQQYGLARYSRDDVLSCETLRQSRGRCRWA